jgi:ATP-dependent protease ClpP protease subunit
MLFYNFQLPSMNNQFDEDTVDIESTLDDSIPVDADDLIQDEKIEEPSNEDQYSKTMNIVETYSDLDIIDFSSISNTYNVEKEFPHCPVYIRKNSTGNLIITAYITGCIEENVKYLTLLEILEHMDTGDEAYIFIDSPGGMVSTGAVIASAIDSCKGKVTGIARGFCASAASLIWSACHVNVASPLAVFLYHMSSHVDIGNSEDIRERATILVEYVKNTLLKVALDKGHITQEEYMTILKSKEDVIIPAPVMIERLQGAK